MKYYYMSHGGGSVVSPSSPHILLYVIHDEGWGGASVSQAFLGAVPRRRHMFLEFQVASRSM